MSATISISMSATLSTSMLGFLLRGALQTSFRLKLGFTWNTIFFISSLESLTFNMWGTSGTRMIGSLLRRSVKSKCDQSKSNQCQDWRLMWRGPKVTSTALTENAEFFKKYQIRKIWVGATAIMISLIYDSREIGSRTGGSRTVGGGQWFTHLCRKT